MRKIHKGDHINLNNKCDKFRIHIIYGSRVTLFGGLKFWN